MTLKRGNMMTEIIHTKTFINSFIIRKTKREKLTERNDAKLKRNVQF